MTESIVTNFLTNLSNRIIERHVRQRIDQELDSYPCVVILGQRQIGKSTLARKHYMEKFNAVYRDLENKESLKEIGNGINFFKKHKGKLIVLDEIQENEDLFPAIKCIIDDQKSTDTSHSKFLLLGSASLEVQKKSSTSLLGRCSYIQMTGILLNELVDYLPDNFYISETNSNETDDKPRMVPEYYSQLINTLLFRGGMPDSLFASSQRKSSKILRNIVEQYVRTDLKSYGFNVDTNSLTECLNQIARSNGEQFEISHFTTNLGMNRKEISDSINALEQLLLVRKLRPLNGYGQFNVRLSKHPKLYIRDSGLLASRLNVQDINELRDRNLFGGVWEGFVIESIIGTAIYSGVFQDCHYFRTHNGDQELDLVLTLENGEKWGFEIKTSLDRQLSKGNYDAAETVQVDKRILVHAGTEVKELKGGFTGYPLIDVLDKIRCLAEGRL